MTRVARPYHACVFVCPQVGVKLASVPKEFATFGLYTKRQTEVSENEQTEL